MTDTELTELARAYVALSNAHNLSLIAQMFNENSIYTSTAVGQFNGRTAIREMMRDFFARYPDVYWQVAEFQSFNNKVTFDFTMTATQADTTECIERKGVERIEFGSSGIIKVLEVETSPTRN